MEKKTKGAWILHHSQKLQATTSQEFDNISFSGKCGTLLSAISASSQIQIPTKKLNGLAKASNISPKSELPAILSELERQKVIEIGSDAVESIGLTSSAILSHTATIFEEADSDNNSEEAIIEISEWISENPLSDQSVIEKVSDKFKLSSTQSVDTIRLASAIGFFDSEVISPSEKLLFNGNLFRREDIKKVNAIISSLKSSEGIKLKDVNDQLQKSGCLTLEVVTGLLGNDLFKKLHSIGMFDVNVVGNESGKHYFVTKPASFSKFTNSFADDALDLAKALVAALTYGMTISSPHRGQIQMINELMRKLIAGGSVGPATAIGNDYQALELRGVLQVTPHKNGMFMMKLLKPDVGKLALEVIQNGDITATTVAKLPGAKVTEYLNPERNRELQRRQSSEVTKTGARNLLNEIRTGGLTR